jgi:hypothetical protein
VSHALANASGNTPALRQHLVDYLPGVVGQALIAAVVAERQLEMIEAEKVQYRRV